MDECAEMLNIIGFITEEKEHAMGNASIEYTCSACLLMENLRD